MTKLTRYALWGCFILALVASWSHVKWAFEMLEVDNRWVPWVAATAVDGGLFALAYSIQQRRRAERGTFWLWVGVAAFAGISMLANWLHAQAVLYGTEFVSTSTIKNVMSFAFSGVLPLLVVYLGEIVSSDDAVAVAEREKEDARRERAAAKIKRESDRLQQRIDALQKENNRLQKEIENQANVVTGLDNLLQQLNPKAQHSLLYIAGQHTNMDEAATAAGVSKATISRMVGNLNGV